MGTNCPPEYTVTPHPPGNVAEIGRDLWGVLLLTWPPGEVLEPLPIVTPGPPAVGVVLPPVLGGLEVVVLVLGGALGPAHVRGRLLLEVLLLVSHLQKTGIRA